MPYCVFVLRCHCQACFSMDPWWVGKIWGHAKLLPPHCRMPYDYRHPPVFMMYYWVKKWVIEERLWRWRSLYTFVWAYEAFDSISHTLIQMFKVWFSKPDFERHWQMRLVGFIIRQQVTHYQSQASWIPYWNLISPHLHLKDLKTSKGTLWIPSC